MLKMHSRFLRIYVTPLIASFIGVFPWYLFLKYVLKFDSHLELLAISLGLWFFFGFYMVERWKEKVPDKKERERVAEKLFTQYGKAVALKTSVSFVIAVLIIIIALVSVYLTSH
jgi:hypothetical protein